MCGSAKPQQHNFDEIFHELEARCDTEGFTEANDQDLDRWSCKFDVSWFEFLDLFGVELAKRYHSGAVDYAFGDSIVNAFWCEMIDRSSRVPFDHWASRFDEVYEAFDAGELPHPEDGGGDPVKLYTNPAIADFLSKLD